MTTDIAEINVTFDGTNYWLEVSLASGYRFEPTGPFPTLASVQAAKEDVIQMLKDKGGTPIPEKLQ